MATATTLIASANILHALSEVVRGYSKWPLLCLFLFQFSCGDDVYILCVVVVSVFSMAIRLDLFYATTTRPSRRQKTLGFFFSSAASTTAPRRPSPPRQPVTPRRRLLLLLYTYISATYCVVIVVVTPELRPCCCGGCVHLSRACL